MNAVLENIRTRRSVRKFLDKPVPRDLLDQVIEAGCFAPSGHDRQPWAIVVITNQEVRGKLSRANADLFDMDVKDPFYGAPVYIVVLTKKRTPTNVYDGALCLGSMMLAAHSLGLASCWIHRAKQEFEQPQWQKLLREAGVPLDDEEYEGIGHLALGYADGELPAARPRKAGRVFFVE